ncbi:MAG: hypothetical protein QOG20_6918, partial [Pseudonocardiales bacterium]|nr:hypothetical protein [Pseudonocardiales bacterium]
KPQLEATKGLPERAAVRRRQERVERLMPTLPYAAQQAIRESQQSDLAGAGALSGRSPMGGFADAATAGIPRVAT